MLGIPLDGAFVVHDGIRLAAKFENLDDDPRQVFQHDPFVGTEGARLQVDEVDRAEVETVLGSQRRARMESDSRLADDERVVAEARITRRVLAHHDVATHDGMGTERQLPRHLLDTDTVPRLEPLPGFVDQRNQGNRRPGPGRQHPRQGVEDRLGRHVEDPVARKGGDPLRLVGGNGIVHRFSLPP